MKNIQINRRSEPEFEDGYSFGMMVCGGVKGNKHHFSSRSPVFYVDEPPTVSMGNDALAYALLIEYLDAHPDEEVRIQRYSDDDLKPRLEIIAAAHNIRVELRRLPGYANNYLLEQIEKILNQSRKAVR